MPSFCKMSPLWNPNDLNKERWRCEGYHYGTVLPYLQEQDVHDSVPRWQPRDLPLQEG